MDVTKRQLDDGGVATGVPNKIPKVENRKPVFGCKLTAAQIQRIKHVNTVYSEHRSIEGRSFNNDGIYATGFLAFKNSKSYPKKDGTGTFTTYTVGVALVTAVIDQASSRAQVYRFCEPRGKLEAKRKELFDARQKNKNAAGKNQSQDRMIHDVTDNPEVADDDAMPMSGTVDGAADGQTNGARHGHGGDIDGPIENKENQLQVDMGENIEYFQMMNIEKREKKKPTPAANGAVAPPAAANGATTLSEVATAKKFIPDAYQIVTLEDIVYIQETENYAEKWDVGMPVRVIGLQYYDGKVQCGGIIPDGECGKTPMEKFRHPIDNVPYRLRSVQPVNEMRSGVKIMAFPGHVYRDQFAALYDDFSVLSFDEDAFKRKQSTKVRDPPLFSFEKDGVMKVALVVVGSGVQSTEDPMVMRNTGVILSIYKEEVVTKLNGYTNLDMFKAYASWLPYIPFQAFGKTNQGKNLGIPENINDAEPSDADYNPAKGYAFCLSVSAVNPLFAHAMPTMAYRVSHEWVLGAAKDMQEKYGILNGCMPLMEGKRHKDIDNPDLVNDKSPYADDSSGVCLLSQSTSKSLLFFPKATHEFFVWVPYNDVVKPNHEAFLNLSKEEGEKLIMGKGPEDSPLRIKSLGGFKELVAVRKSALQDMPMLPDGYMTDEDDGEDDDGADVKPDPAPAKAAVVKAKKAPVKGGK
jgi:hypothetical protein